MLSTCQVSYQPEKTSLGGIHPLFAILESWMQAIGYPRLWCFLHTTLAKRRILDLFYQFGICKVLKESISTLQQWSNKQGILNVPLNRHRLITIKLQFFDTASNSMLALFVKLAACLDLGRASNPDPQRLHKAMNNQRRGLVLIFTAACILAQIVGTLTMQILNDWTAPWSHLYGRSKYWRPAFK